MMPHGFRIWRRFIRPAAAFAMPFVLAVAVLYLQSSIGARNTRREMRGVTYLRPAFTLMGLSEYRDVLAEGKRGVPDGAVVAESVRVDVAIDRAFTGLDEVDRELGDVIGTSGVELQAAGKGDLTVGELRRRWREYTAGPAVEVPDVSSRHLSERLRALASHGSESSGLVLYSRIETYNPVTVLVKQAPAVPAAAWYQLANIVNSVTAPAELVEAGAAQATELVRDVSARVRHLVNVVEGQEAQRLKAAKSKLVVCLRELTNAAQVVGYGHPAAASIGTDVPHVAARSIEAHRALTDAVAKNVETAMSAHLDADSTRRGVMSAGLAVMMLLAGRLTLHRLRRLSKDESGVVSEAKSLASGAVECPVKIGGTDETAELDGTFDAVASRILAADEPLSVLRTAITVATEVTEPGEAMELILERLCVGFGWSAGCGYLVSRQGEDGEVSRLSAVHCTEDNPRLPAFVAAWSLARAGQPSSLVRLACRSRRAVWIPPRCDADLSCPDLLLAGPEIVSRVAVPAIARNEVVAVLEFYATKDIEATEVLDTVLNAAAASLTAVIERNKAAERLRAMQADFESAVRAKFNLLAAMSHEIRTPMNAVIGLVELVARKVADTEIREYADLIQRSGEDLMHLVDEVLDFARADNAEIVLNDLEIDLAQCVERAVKIATVHTNSVSVELITKFSANSPESIVCDARKLRQILVNVLVNAIKYTHHGEIVVTVAADDDLSCADEARCGGSASTIEFSISDTGAGMSADQIERAFDPFHQAAPPDGTGSGGVGLGLAICRRLIGAMGGVIWLESEPGAGTIVHFRVPVKRGNSAKPQTTPASLNGRTLLLVDDNATSRQVLSEYAAAWGMEVRATGSPETALEWISRGVTFDAGLLDLHMPSMSGIELGERLRSLAMGSDLSLVLMAPLAGADSSGAEQAGFAARLTKPIRPAELRKVLADLLTCHPAAPVPSCAIPARPHRDPLEILLVDDNKFGRKLATLMLHQLGHVATVVTDGRSALEAARRSHYDLVLLDVRLPSMSGLEVARQLCEEMPRQVRPYIIAMTADTLPEDRANCLAAGMDDYLAKPLHIEELERKLAACAVHGPDIRRVMRPQVILDTGRTRELMGTLGRHVVTGLVADFTADAPRLIQTMRQAVLVDDLLLAIRCVHTLRSSATAFGAERLGRLCAAAEATLKEGDVGGLAKRIDEITAEYLGVQSALQKLVGVRPSVRQLPGLGLTGRGPSSAPDLLGPAPEEVDRLAHASARPVAGPSETSRAGQPAAEHLVSRLSGRSRASTENVRSSPEK